MRSLSAAVLIVLLVACSGDAGPTGPAPTPQDVEEPPLVFTHYRALTSLNNFTRVFRLGPLTLPDDTFAVSADRPPLVSCFVGEGNPADPTNPEAVATWIPIEQMAEVDTISPTYVSTHRSSCSIAIREPSEAAMWDVEASLHMQDGGRLATHWEGWFFQAVWMDGTPRNSDGIWVISEATDILGDQPYTYKSAEVALPLGMGSADNLPWATCYVGNSPGSEGVWLIRTPLAGLLPWTCVFTWRNGRWVARVENVLTEGKQLRVVAAVLP